MDNQSNERISQAIVAARTAIKDIKIFVWAGDYQNARRIIQESYSNYGEELRLAYELRKDVLKAERTIRKELPSDEEKTLTEHQIKAMNVASKNAGEIVAGKTDLFSLGVLASILLKLDKRISEEADTNPQIPKDFQKKRKKRFPDQKTLFETLSNDSESGLEHMLIPLGENRLEIRAFRFKNLDKNLNELENRLLHFQDINLRKAKNIKDKDGKDTYPYQYVGFSENAHVEVTILDSNRIKVYIATENPEIIEKISSSILDIFG